MPEPLNIKAPEPGIYYDVPFSTYIQIPAINNSVLKELFTNTPKSAKHYHTYGRETSCLAFGRLYHVLLLEPSQFNNEYAVGPDVNKNAKAWKEFAATAKEAGKEAIKPVQLAAAKAFVAKVKEQYVHRFVSMGRAEVTLIWRDTEPVDIVLQLGDKGERELHFEPTGLLCKSRIDYEHHDNAILVDLKGMQSVAQRKVERDVETFGYYQQAGMSHDGWEMLTQMTPAFDFLCVEKCPGKADPLTWHYDATLDETQPTTLDHGRAAFHWSLAKWAECESNQHWPGRSDVVRPLELDPWALARISGRLD